MKFCPNTGALGVFQHVLKLSCCAALLNSSLAPYLTFPSSPTYNALVNRHYAKTAPLEPACFFHPQSAEHVSQAVSILVDSDDGSPECIFAIRGGGHNPGKGAASAHGGVTIDLSMLNEMVYNPDSETLDIMAGANWGQVYQYLKPMGVAVTGGRSDTVGVGGLIIGGGMSYFAPRYGLACDNVLRFEIVLANGTIAAATATRNLDLFKALKGGSNNFGIVTRVTLKTFPQGPLWGGIIGHEPSAIPAQITALTNFTSHMKDDPNAMLVTIWQHGGKDDVDFAASGLQYTIAEQLDEATIFDDFLDIPSTFSTLRETDIYDLMMETAPPPGNRALFLTATFKNDANVLEHLHGMHDDGIHAVKSAGLRSEDWNFITFLQPWPAIFWDGSRAPRHGNVLGLDRLQGDHLLLLLFLAWDDEADDTTFHEIGYGLIDTFKAYTKELGAHSEYVYMNYAAKEQNVMAGYGKESLKFLREVARKYDPHGVFQTQVPGGFKVSRA
ncbi:hypothetical protein BDV19DRAFT_400448 [Aspergillus venezuelensis]